MGGVIHAVISLCSRWAVLLSLFVSSAGDVNEAGSDPGAVEQGLFPSPCHPLPASSIRSLSPTTC